MPHYDPLFDSLDQTGLIKCFKCLAAPSAKWFGEVLLQFLIDQTILNAFEIIGMNHLGFQVIGYIAGLYLTLLLFACSDVRLICYILEPVIDNCLNIPSQLFYLIMGGGIFAKLILALKEVNTTRMNKERHQELLDGKQELLDSNQRLHDKLDAVLAQNESLSGRNGEPLQRFKARIAKEQREKIVGIINNQLTHALDSYDGITLRYDPLAVQRQFDAEDMA